jgi:hypothetical protein
MRQYKIYYSKNKWQRKLLSPWWPGNRKRERERERERERDREEGA